MGWVCIVQSCCNSLQPPPQELAKVKPLLSNDLHDVNCILPTTLSEQNLEGFQVSLYEKSSKSLEEMMVLTAVLFIVTASVILVLCFIDSDRLRIRLWHAWGIYEVWNYS